MIDLWTPFQDFLSSYFSLYLELPYDPLKTTSEYLYSLEVATIRLNYLLTGILIIGFGFAFLWFFKTLVYMIYSAWFK